MQVSQIFRRKQSQEVDAGSKQTLVPVGAFNLLKTGATNVLFPDVQRTSGERAGFDAADASGERRGAGESAECGSLDAEMKRRAVKGN